MRAHPRRYRTCNNCKKNIYPSQVVAEDMAAYRQALEGGPIIGVYECPVRPGTWHITKSNMAARHRREGRTVDE